MDMPHIENQIRERAYAIWEKEGRPHGREWDHWVRAAGELAVREELPAAAPTEPAAKTPAKRRPTRARKASA
jgi:hypothetical protein